MNTRLAIALISTLALGACDKKPAEPQTPGAPANPAAAPAAAPTPAPQTPATRGDFSTPSAAAKAFFAAAVAKDKNLLAECVSENASSETKHIRAKDLTDNDYDMLAQTMRDAKIENERINDDGVGAEIRFKSPKDFGYITMIKEGGRWWVTDL